MRNNYLYAILIFLLAACTQQQIDVQGTEKPLKIDGFTDASITYFGPWNAFDGEGVRCVAEHEGTVYVTTETRIWKYAAKTFEETGIEDGFPALETYCYLKSSEGKEFLLATVDSSIGEKKAILVRDGTNISQEATGPLIDRLYLDSQDRVWAAGGPSDIRHREPNGTWVEHTRSGLLNAGFNQFLGYERETGQVYVDTNELREETHIIRRYREGEWDQGNQLPSNSNFIDTGNRYLFIHERGDLELYDKNSSQLLDTIELDPRLPLPHYIYQDSTGGVWVDSLSKESEFINLILIRFNEGNTADPAMSEGPTIITADPLEYRKLEAGEMLYLPEVTLYPDSFMENEEASLTLHIYTDYTSGPSRRWWNSEIMDLEREYLATGKLRLELHHPNISILYPDTPIMVNAIKCAAEHGQGWNMAKLIADSGSTKYDSVLIQRGVKYLGLPNKTFSRCVSQRAQMAAVTAEFKQSARDGINGVPVFRIQEEVYRGGAWYPEVKRRLDELTSEQE